uniref:Uncharacterized protein n=1 Tax=Pyxicephalus adspersus TaxID=30357 RepID=A0AAV3AUR4_PYXAD|nr:TPA: hypothetical protein GDO54_010662 [Pyxicephalus adspersus]
MLNLSSFKLSLVKSPHFGMCMHPPHNPVLEQRALTLYEQPIFMQTLTFRMTVFAKNFWRSPKAEMCNLSFCCHISPLLYYCML